MNCHVEVGIIIFRAQLKWNFTDLSAMLVSEIPSLDRDHL
jgi:hypothetical protein